MQPLLSLVGRHAYWALALVVAGDNLGLPVPGEIAVLLAAAMAGEVGLSLASIILVATLAAVAGDHGSYLIGRRGGGRLLKAYCRATFCSRDCGRLASRFFQRFGIWTVMLARFVPGLRAFAGPFAGLTRMRYWKFLFADLVGALVWATVMAVLGSASGPALAHALGRMSRFEGFAVAGLMAALAATMALRNRRVRKHGLLIVRASALPAVEEAGASSEAVAPDAAAKVR